MTAKHEFRALGPDDFSFFGFDGLKRENKIKQRIRQVEIRGGTQNGCCHPTSKTCEAGTSRTACGNTGKTGVNCAGKGPAGSARISAAVARPAPARAAVRQTARATPAAAGRVGTGSASSQRPAPRPRVATIPPARVACQGRTVPSVRSCGWLRTSSTAAPNSNRCGCPKGQKCCPSGSLRNCCIQDPRGSDCCMF